MSMQVFYCIVIVYNFVYYRRIIVKMDANREILRKFDKIEKLNKFFSENKFKEDPLGPPVGNFFDFWIEVTP